MSAPKASSRAAGPHPPLQQSQLSKSASWAEERRGGLGVLCPLPALVPFQGTALARSLSPSLALGTRALRSLLH